jgi:hypothetical protein
VPAEPPRFDTILEHFPEVDTGFPQKMRPTKEARAVASPPGQRARAHGPAGQDADERGHDKALAMLSAHWRAQEHAEGDH